MALDEAPRLATGSSVAMTPVAAAQRIDTVDILRGFALFGILVVNMAYFSHTIYALIDGLNIGQTPIDRAAEWLIRFLFEGKFYSLFSFLFGLGLVLQMTRAQARGAPFVPLFVRRLLVLLGIGLLHATLIWTGDILVIYALLGFVLLLFRNRSPRALLLWALVMLALPLLLAVLGAALLGLGSLEPNMAAEMNRSIAATEADYDARDRAASVVYATGNFAQITAQRLTDLAFFYPVTIFFAPNVLGMFLLGLYAGRRGIPYDISGHLPLIRRMAVWGLGLGLPLNLIYAIAGGLSSRTSSGTVALVAGVTMAIGVPLLSLGYAASLSLLAQKPDWAARLAPLAAAGRLALTNYLMQSLVATFIFYGYGLGLFNQVGAAAGFLLAIVIYALQLPLSVWWLRHFQIGPAEWLWRTLTYGRRQPFRRPAPVT
jgi:uncharacterized protein